MENPIKQYHEVLLDEMDSKRILDRVNAQLAPGGTVNLSAHSSKSA